MFRNLRLVYITTSNVEEARKIGKELVQDKLAACVNILDNMESIYRWEGELITDSECILIAKTTYSNISALTKRVKELHSADVPCVISVNLAEQEGNEDYLNWLLTSVKPPLPPGADLKN
jgi:periplasmic divalent cation tolerance protein